MYDFGNSDLHSNKIDFGDVAAVDALTAYSIAFWINVNAAVAGSSDLVSKWSANTGWIVQLNSSEQMVMFHGDGAANTSVTCTTAFVVGTMAHAVITWDGSNVDFYIDGALINSPAMTRSIADTGDALEIAQGVAGNQGVAMALGQLMIWNVDIGAGGVTSLYGGVVPRGDALKVWAPGYTDPGLELVGQNSATKTGTVTIIEDAFATWPVPHLEQSTLLNTTAGVPPPPSSVTNPGGGKYAVRGLYHDTGAL